MAQDYECIQVRMRRFGDSYELFVRKNDEGFELIGHRPFGYENVPGLREEDCTKYRRLAHIVLPRKLTDLGSLLKGDVISVKHTTGIPTIFDGCVYSNKRDARKNTLSEKESSDIVPSDEII